MATQDNETSAEPQLAEVDWCSANHHDQDIRLTHHHMSEQYHCHWRTHWTHRHSMLCNRTTLTVSQLQTLCKRKKTLNSLRQFMKLSPSRYASAIFLPLSLNSLWCDTRLVSAQNSHTIHTPYLIYQKYCSLWPPCVADADILFLSCFFLLSFFFFFFFLA